MTDSSANDGKRLSIKQKFLRRAISEGRGREAIEAMNGLYRNKCAMQEGSDETLMTRLTALALQEAARDAAAERKASPFADSQIAKGPDLTGRLITRGPTTMQ